MYSFLPSFPKCLLRTRPCAGYSVIETNQAGSLLACEFKLHVEAVACSDESKPHRCCEARAFGTEPRESFVGVGSGRVLSYKALFKALGLGLEGRQGGEKARQSKGRALKKGKHVSKQVV